MKLEVNAPSVTDAKGNLLLERRPSPVLLPSPLPEAAWRAKAASTAAISSIFSCNFC